MVWESGGERFCLYEKLTDLNFFAVIYCDDLTRLSIRNWKMPFYFQLQSLPGSEMAMGLHPRAGLGCIFHDIGIQGPQRTESLLHVFIIGF